MSDVKSFKISEAVLNALVPQKGMLNSKVEELENQTFVLAGLVTSIPKGNPEQALGDNTDTDAAQRVRVRYINKKSKQALLIPVRALLGLPVATLAANAKFKEEMPTVRVFETMVEKPEEANLSMVSSFTVVSVKPRKHSSGNIMYPQYMYKKFNDAVKVVNDAAKEAGVEPDLSSVYNNFELMQGLYSDKPEARFVNPEPIKDIVIKLNS